MFHKPSLVRCVAMGYIYSIYCIYRLSRLRHINMLKQYLHRKSVSRSIAEDTSEIVLSLSSAEVFDASRAVVSLSSAYDPPEADGLTVISIKKDVPDPSCAVIQ